MCGSPAWGATTRPAIDKDATRAAVDAAVDAAIDGLTGGHPELPEAVHEPIARFRWGTRK